MSVHPTAIVGPMARVAEDAYVGPYCVIQGFTMIWAGTRVEAHSSIGAPPELRGKFGSDGGKYGSVVILENCVIREFTTINCGAYGATWISSGCILLKGAHVGHDCFLGEDVTLSTNVTLGGHCHVQTGANLGLGVVVHQRSIIGAYSMVGMGSVVTKTSDIYPGALAYGTPARVMGRNSVGIDRGKVTKTAIEVFTIDYHKWKDARKDDDDRKTEINQ